jgi:hypothetical protein
MHPGALTGPFFLPPKPYFRGWHGALGVKTCDCASGRATVDGFFPEFAIARQGVYNRERREIQIPFGVRWGDRGEGRGIHRVFAWMATVIHMTLESIFVFALALLAAGCVALAWLIFATRASLNRVGGRVAIARGHWLNLVERVVKLEKQAPVALAAKVDELSEAVAKLAETHRRFAGRMDRRYQLDRDEGDPREPVVDDPVWNALRAAQQRILGTPPNGSDT